MQYCVNFSPIPEVTGHLLTEGITDRLKVVEAVQGTEYKLALTDCSHEELNSKTLLLKAEWLH